MKTYLCFIVAMEAEAKELIKTLNLSEDLTFAKSLPMRAWIGIYNNKSIAVAINGQDETFCLDLIGTQAATLTTQLAITHFNPEIIISAGTAGAFIGNGAKIGDVYLSYPHVIFHDRRVAIEGWDKMGIGRYKVMDITNMATALNLKTAIITTGNSLDMPAIDEKTIKENEGEIKEMEAAAVAWVSSLHKKNMFCIKAVTDLVDVDHPTHEQFLKNLKQAVSNLTKQSMRVVDYLTLQ